MLVSHYILGLFSLPSQDIDLEQIFPRSKNIIPSLSGTLWLIKPKNEVDFSIADKGTFVPLRVKIKVHQSKTVSIGIVSSTIPFTAQITSC